MSQAVDGDRETAPTPTPTAAGPIGLLERLWRRRLLAAVVWGACVVAGFLYLFLAAPVYQSVATLSAAKPPDGSPPPAADALFDQAGVIASADVVSDAIAQSELKDLPTIRGKSDPVSYVTRSLQVVVQKASLEIQVGMPAASADDSATITNAVVRAYLTRQTRTRSAQQSGQDATTANVRALDAQRDTALGALLQFKQANPAFITPDSADALGKRIAKLNDDLAQAQSDAVAAKAEFDADQPKLADAQQASVLVRLARSKNIFGKLDEQSDEVENELGPLQKTLAEQRQKLGVQNPAVVKTQTQINALTQRESEIDGQRAIILATYLQHQLDLANARIKAIQDDLASGKAEAKDYATKAIEFHRLEQASQSADAAATQADDRFRQVQALGGSAAILTLSNPAHPEATPAWPQPVPVLAIALIGGLFLGVIAGVIRVDSRH